MPPDLISALAAQHRADLLRTAARRRAGRPGPWAHHRAVASALRWWRRAGRPRLSGGAAARVVPPAPPASVFADGPEAYGFRVFLTPEEAGQLARECATMLDRFADRLGDPAARPPGAQPLEVVLLSRRLPVVR